MGCTPQHTETKMLKKLYEKFRAWKAARAAQKELEDFERGRRWAHEEITFGRGYTFVEIRTWGAWSAFDRGAHKALEQHAVMQQMLGRARRANVQADAELEKVLREFEGCAVRNGRWLGENDEMASHSVTPEEHN